VGALTSTSDTALVGSTLGSVFAKLAVEGGGANGITDGTYTGFSDPLSNDQGAYAFIGTVKGPKSSGISGANNTGIWYGAGASPQLVARTGFPAPDAIGNNGTTLFTKFTNIALPNRAHAPPILL